MDLVSYMIPRNPLQLLACRIQAGESAASVPSTGSGSGSIRHVVRITCAQICLQCPNRKHLTRVCYTRFGHLLVHDLPGLHRHRETRGWARRCDSWSGSTLRVKTLHANSSGPVAPLARPELRAGAAFQEAET
jgi:hypothetical protein